MIFEYSNYRVFLRDTLATRMTRNPQYSLRSMAQGFGISPAQLSKVQNGKRNLSLQNAVNVSRKLQLSPKETEYFCLLVQLEAAKSPDVQESLLGRIHLLMGTRKKNHLPLDQFRLISDWYHIPILEMTNLVRFKFTPANVAAKLGISVIEASAAIDRLLRLGLIAKTGPTTYAKTQKNVMIESEAASESLRQFHQQMLDKARAAIWEQSPEEKFTGTETVAISPRDLPEAKKMIGKFMDELSASFDPRREKSVIYHLGVQFFRLTKDRGTLARN